MFPNMHRYQFKGNLAYFLLNTLYDCFVVSAIIQCSLPIFIPEILYYGTDTLPEYLTNSETVTYGGNGEGQNYIFHKRELKKK